MPLNSKSTNPRSFKKRNIDNSLLLCGIIWRGLMELGMIPSKARKRELRSLKSFPPKLTLMLRRKRFIVCYEKQSENTTEYLKKAKGVISLNLGGLEDNMNNCNN